MLLKQSTAAAFVVVVVAFVAFVVVVDSFAVDVVT